MPTSPLSPVLCSKELKNPSNSEATDTASVTVPQVCGQSFNGDTVMPRVIMVPRGYTAPEMNDVIIKQYDQERIHKLSPVDRVHFLAEMNTADVLLIRPWPEIDFTSEDVVVCPMDREDLKDTDPYWYDHFEVLRDAATVRMSPQALTLLVDIVWSRDSRARHMLGHRHSH